MNYKDFFKSLLPHLLIIAGFAVLSFIYFYPEMNGKELPQHDIKQARGMSHELSEYAKSTGKDALWTDSMFGGMPAYQIRGGVSYNIYLWIQRYMGLNLPYLTVSIVFMYLLGFYILLASLKFNRYLCIIGAIAFAFSSYNIIIIMAGHSSKAYALGYAAPVLAGILLLFDKKYIAGFLLTMMTLGLELSTNHPQITYYLFLIIGLFLIVKFIYAMKEKEISSFIKSSVLFLIAVVLAVAPSITNLWTTYEYGKYTTRGQSDLTDNTGNQTTGLDKDYILDQYSYGVSEAFVLMIPNFKGGSSIEELSTNSETYKVLSENNIGNAKEIIKQMPTFWGDQSSTSGPVYIGAIICFLFILGLFLVKGPVKWWLLSATVFSIMLAWGRNFMTLSDLFIDYFPGYSKFRTVSMILVVASICIPLLGIWVIQQILDKKITRDKILKGLKYAFYITGGITLLFALFGGAFFDFSSPADEEYKNYFKQMYEPLMTAIRADRASLLRADAFRSFIFILLSAGLIWAFVKEKIKPVFFLSALGLLILIDQWSVARRYLSSDNFVSKREARNEFQPTEADRMILQDSTIFRVMNTTVSTFNDATTSYYHKSIGGYHGAKMKRYQELIERHIGKGHMNVLDMLNTKYFIVYSQDHRQIIPQKNVGALGNAWFVNNFVLVNNANEEIDTMNNFNPATTAIIDKRFTDAVKSLDKTDTSSVGKIRLVTYKPDDLTYTCETNKEKLAVFSEIYYDKGWNAYVDGKISNHIRVNYVLRAMVVPAGKHTIEFKFEPKSFIDGQKISLASSVLVVLLCAGGIVLMIKKKKE